jgi:hypothetical protein
MKIYLRAMIGSGVVVAALLISTVGPTAAGASNGSGYPYPIDYSVKASTTLAKLHQTVTVPPGTFIGTLNLNTFVLKGKLNLPAASTTVSLAGIGLATATFKFSETKPVTGKLNISSWTVSSSASFNVSVTSVKPLDTGVNLVGNSCATSKPMSVPFSGKFTFVGSSKFSGIYTIPPLKNCELATTALNFLLPGPGNVITASFAPAN